MDLIKIGTYIAGKRKTLGMTQKQLAEQLGMSDKSVSKWERGICLPDVALYAELCQILGISINEFFAGEDITKEDLMQKSEENIIGVAKESKQKQKRLRSMLCLMLAVSVLVLSAGGIILYRSNGPQNVIAPVDQESVEMKTVELLSGVDGAFMYQYVTTDSYASLKIFVSEYHSGKLIQKEPVLLGHEEIGSPKHGTVLIVPDFDHFTVKIIIADDASKFSTEIPILERVEDRAYYGRSASEITRKTDVVYNKEQPLVALVYGKNQVRSIDLHDVTNGTSEALAENDYVYYFSFEFCK